MTATSCLVILPVYNNLLLLDKYIKIKIFDKFDINDIWALSPGNMPGNENEHYTLEYEHYFKHTNLSFGEMLLLPVVV